MPSRQMERALREGAQPRAQSDAMLMVPPTAERVPLDLKQRKGKQGAVPGQATPKAAKAFAKAFREHGETLAGASESASGQLPGLDSRFGDLVTRMISRRFGSSGAVREQVTAAIAAAAATKKSSSMRIGSMSLPHGGTPSTAVSLDPRLVLLVNRVTGGFLESEYGLARSLGPVGYLDHHFGLDETQDTALNTFFTSVPDIVVNPCAPMTPTYQDVWSGVMGGSAVDLFFLEANAIPTMIPTGNGLVGIMQGTAIGRGMLSKRLLLERMTEFWTDHFNIDIFTMWQGWLKPVDDRTVIRESALVSFHTMLHASVHSAAMLLYLDQASSSKPDANENYARELLELHTVGEGQGYNEDDVRDVADLLTGFSFSLQDLEFDFDSSLHVEAPMNGYSILKLHPHPISIAKDPLTSPTEGQKEGEDLISGLQRHPLTAQYISRKLLRYMLSYTPTQQQVDELALVYRNTNGNVEAMIREILKPANLDGLLSTQPTTLKVKRPFQLATSFLRSLGGVPEWFVRTGGKSEDGGSGYALGDVLTAQGGALESGGSPASFEVTAVDGLGAVVNAKLTFEGEYQTLPPLPTPTTTTGSGTGCTVKLFPVVDNPFEALNLRLRGLGNAPFEWGPPNGYPDAEQAWIGNLLGRWELLGDLARNEVKGIVVDQDALINKLIGVPGNEMGAHLNQIMAGGALTNEEEILIQGYFNVLVFLATQPLGGPTYLAPEEIGAAVAELFALVGTAPSYQYY